MNILFIYDSKIETMRIFTKPALILAAVAFQFAAIGQVTFTDQSSMLNSTTGSSYEDCAVDMNSDGLDDIVRVTNGQLFIDYQQPGGEFVQESWSINPNAYPSWSLCAGDLNADGVRDLCFGGGSAVSFLVSDGMGGWVVQDESDYIFSQRNTMADIDNDGDLDAFVCHDVDLSHPYRNDGTGDMVEDQSLIETIDMPGNYAAIWVDYDNDWDTDLYMTKCRLGSTSGDVERTNRMFRNNGDGTYTEVGSEINMDDNSQSWATVFEDFDNDGDFDSFTVNHDFTNRFMQNDGSGNFTDIIDQTGIDPYDLGAWECYAADFDNDGFVDILSEMDDELLMNNGDLTFDYNYSPFSSGGIGDMNNDGFLDCIRGNTLWINDGNDNNWVKVDLEGIVSNKDGIGARVEIHGDWGVQIREIRSGQSFSPMQSLIAHFGLGEADSIDQLVIKWPSGIETVIDNPAINTQHNVLETDCLNDPNEITASGPVEICPGDELTLSADAGDSYTWSNGEESQDIVVTEPGVFSVVIWDAEGCASLSNTITVTYVPDGPPILTLDGDDVFCEGGMAIITSTGAATYDWSNGETTQSIEVTESGDYSVAIDAACSDDQWESDVITIVVMESADEPTATDVEIPAPGTAMMSATGENLRWYETEMSDEVLGEGDTFETDFFDASISYWVEANMIHEAPVEAGGKLSYDGGGGIPSSGGVLFFDAETPFVLQEVTVFVPDNTVEGSRTIVLYDGMGVEIDSYTADFTYGEHQVPLMFDVPAGTGLSIGCNENNFFRNNSGVNYPYPIGSVGSIYDSTFGGGYYYYFYDWQVKGEDIYCPSARVEVMGTVVGIEEIDALNSFNAYPNPSSTDLFIEMELVQQSDVTLMITDMSGKVVFSNILASRMGHQIETIDVAQLASGVYMLSLDVEGQKLHTRIIVE